MAEQKQDPQSDGHPIRYLIASVLKDGEPGKEPAELQPEGLETIRGAIRSYIGSKELVDCVEMVLAVAGSLEVDHKSPKAAALLFQLVENDEIIGALKELNREKEADRSEHVAKAADKLTAFTGVDSQKKAPKGDESAPKGSVKLGSLDFPKKL